MVAETMTTHLRSSTNIELDASPQIAVGIESLHGSLHGYHQVRGSLGVFA